MVQELNGFEVNAQQTIETQHNNSPGKQGDCECKNDNEQCTPASCECQDEECCPPEVEADPEQDLKEL